VLLLVFCKAGGLCVGPSRGTKVEYYRPSQWDRKPQRQKERQKVHQWRHCTSIHKVI
jgi:hypothetical protein